MPTWDTTVSVYSRCMHLRIIPPDTSRLQKTTFWNYYLYSEENVYIYIYLMIGVRLVLGEKGKKTITDLLEHTEELQAEIVMERSESSHRSWEPHDSRVLVEGWPCWPGHARLPGLVLGKCVHCFVSRVLGPVLHTETSWGTATTTTH